jgi:CheY-like chemotaxis protein
MGYQALLFCPDERTARTVTQVLRELDFSVITCTEPFDAVKKLMAEHFDAVVVDCDYEQNATLLFRSARNAPNNQSSLAVAVVEGQTGVARAFRIGANLVLTKPVNVEQAKGTLRVARGLLRKSEAAKPAAGAASTSAKSPAHVPAPSKLAPQPPTPAVAIAGPTPISPLVAMATASSPTQNLAQARSVDARPTEITESDAEILELSEEAASPSIVVPEVKIAASQPEIVSRTVEHSPSSLGSGTGAASAPAPALEPKPRVATERKPSTVISEPQKPVEKAAARRSSCGNFCAGAYAHLRRHGWPRYQAFRRREQESAAGSGRGCADGSRWLRSMDAMGAGQRTCSCSCSRCPAPRDDSCRRTANSAKPGSGCHIFRHIFGYKFDSLVNSRRRSHSGFGCSGQQNSSGCSGCAAHCD